MGEDSGVRNKSAIGRAGNLSDLSTYPVISVTQLCQKFRRRYCPGTFEINPLGQEGGTRRESQDQARAQRSPRPVYHDLGLGFAEYC